MAYAISIIALVFMTEVAIAQTDAAPRYMGSETCSACHEEAADAWRGSHHAKAWTPPLPQHVLGDFDNATFIHQGITTRFYRDAGRYMIDTDGPDGTITSYPVHSVAGVAPLQQYLIETEPGRLQSFDVVWDTQAKRWYHLYPDQVLKGGDGLHWTGPYKNWNARCAECHATGFEKNYTPITRSYASRQAEIGVGCEACHGPGEAHLAWAETRQSPWLEQDGAELTPTGLTIDLSLGGERMLQQCASCHARRETFEQGNPLPGTPFHDAYRLSLLRDGMYHADGQILEEVYVYGSFLQSKMYAKGVTCTHCHEAHSATRRIEGNGLCTQCHGPNGNPDFPSLTRKIYDSPSHHFHEAGSEGAQCKSCHMIERNYMVVDGRRDHSFRIPRPDLSRETRAPNACNDCHQDRSADWAAAAIENWYPDSAHRGPHYGQTLAGARRDLEGHKAQLAQMARYTALPGIARATALDMLMQAPDPALATQLAGLLADPDPLVRAAAIPIQRGAAPDLRAARLVDLLGDPVKSVRLVAAREFLSMPRAPLSPTARDDLGNAMREWQGSLRAKADFPEIQMVLGGVGLTTRRMEVALRAFGEATALDPQLTQAWTMMIRIHDALGDQQAARIVADQAVAANPDDVALNLLRAGLY